MVLFLKINVGRFTHDKNQSFLIDIFKAVHDRDKNTVLLLVGGGEADDTLKNYCMLREFGYMFDDGGEL